MIIYGLMIKYLKLNILNILKYSKSLNINSINRSD